MHGCHRSSLFILLGALSTFVFYSKDMNDGDSCLAESESTGQIRSSQGGEGNAQSSEEWCF